jgi:Alr-MurF fusion protein
VRYNRAGSIHYQRALEKKQEHALIYLDHLLTATQGELIYPGTHTSFTAFNHDTRQLLPGEMFVAVRGEHGDGHDFVRDAARRGAAGILIESPWMQQATLETRQELELASTVTIVVADTRLALQQYASAILKRWHPIVIAVTGSTGKTSHKEAIATVLSSSYATFKSWQNYNDLLGLPLTLGRLEEHHEYAVLEIACDHPGEIAQLCTLVRPTLGVVTNISPNQLQYFGSLENLAAELLSLLNWLPVGGAGFVGDLHGYALPAGLAAPVYTMEQDVVRKATVAWSGLSLQIAAEDQQVAAELHSRLIGKQHVATLLAAYTLGRHCGIPSEQIKRALEPVESLRGRLRILPGFADTTLLDDTHNACPASMIAGLQALRTLPGGLRIAVLGDMLRLGEFALEAHRAVGEYAADCVDYLITRGELAAQIAEAARQAGLPSERTIATATHEDAAQIARKLVTSATGGQKSRDRRTILIKGSEETRMERVTEMLMAKPELAAEELVRQNPGWKQIVLMRPERPTWLEIDLGAIANNTRHIKELVGPDVRILASLKADGYGHGALKVARTVLHNGASMLGIATVSEAHPLRLAGITAPILVFGYVPLWQMREAVSLDLSITIYASDAAQALSRAAQALGKTVQIHIKVDTGMSRLGIRSEQVTELLALIQEIGRLPGLQLEGIFTHFAWADAEDLSHAHLQLIRFQNVLQIIDKAGIRPPLVHAANSAAILSLPEAHFNMVRPGIALYGLEPSPAVSLPAGFRPALSFKTLIAQVKLIPAGEGISYGCTYITERPTLIAVLPVGYADGFRRTPANWGSVLIHGQEAPLLGRVCMDQCIVDISQIPQARVGDEVVLIGSQEGKRLTAEMVAQRLGTVNYEVVSEILARVPRID